MESLTINGTLWAEYGYNRLGQQVVRELPQAAQVIHTVHDLAGQRVAEYDYDNGSATLIREYVWLDGAPVAVIEGGAVYFVRSDHIGRPVFATDDTGSVVWEASYLPFGGVHTTTGPPIDLRFPGQWFQSESGLHQRGMRDYDPTLGNYVQADPLGLVDGPSVYRYAAANPGRYVDPRGLFYGDPGEWEDLDGTILDPDPYTDTVPGGRHGGGDIEIMRMDPDIGVMGAGLGLLLLAIIDEAEELPFIKNVPDGYKDLTPGEEECPSDDDCNPANAPFWNSLDHYRAGIRMSGVGRKRMYYVWDYLHDCEVEVYNRKGRHMGAVDARTGVPIKPAVAGRRLGL